MRKTNPISGGAGWGEARGTRDDCAKRTQFGTSAQEWARGGGAGRPRRAKDAKRTQFLDCGFRIADWGFGDGLAAELPIVQNEPNLEGQSCKTNPIPGGWDAPPFQYPIVPAFQSDVNCAKRTQFRPSAQEWARGAGPGGPDGQKMQNEPNSSIADCGFRIGGTDFRRRCRSYKTNPICSAAPGGPPSPLDPPASPPPSRLCKTNPIPGGAGWDGATGAWDARQSCKTNPISKVQKIHHRGTEVVLDSRTDMTSISFSVPSVSPW